jgi:hypothetical protein
MAYRIAYYQPLLPEKSAITSAVNALSSAYKTGKNIDVAEDKLNKIIDNLNKLNSEIYDGEEPTFRVPNVYMYEQERNLVSGRVDVLKAAIQSSKNQQLIDSYTDRSNIEIDKSYKLPSNEADLRKLLSEGWSYPGGALQQEGDGQESGGEGGGRGGGSNAPATSYLPSNIPIDDDLWQQAADYYAAQQGVTLPSYFKEMVRYAAEIEPSSNKIKKYQQNISARVSDFKAGANALHDRALSGLGYKYQNNTIFRNDPLRNSILSENEEILKQLAIGARQSGLSVEQIQTAVASGASEAIDDYNALPTTNSTAFDVTFNLAQNVALAYATGGLSIGQQIAFNAAYSYLQGAKPEDIVRGAIGSLVANQFGPLKDGQTTGVGVIDDFNKTVQAIGSPELQSAIFNGVRQGVYATATEQNIAKNMAAGAIAGAIATNIQNKYKDPALASAAGEYLQAKIAGKSDFEAAAAAFSGYATEEERQNAKKVVDEEVSALPLDQVQALGYKTQDEITGSTFPQQKPLQDDEYGGTKTQERELPPVEVVAQRDPENLDGLSLIRRVRTGDEVDRGGSLPSVEVVAQREPEEEVSAPQRLITESAQETQQEEPEAQRQENNTVLLGLLGGNMRSDIPRTQRAPSESQAANMQALSQALSVGDPGAALFGSGLGRRRNVWNVESLRLKDELGG